MGPLTPPQLHAALLHTAAAVVKLHDGHVEVPARAVAEGARLRGSLVAAEAAQDLRDELVGVRNGGGGSTARTLTAALLLSLLTSITQPAGGGAERLVSADAPRVEVQRS